MQVHARYGAPVSRNMMNLLSSHDTARFLNECGGDARLHRLAAAMQFTWVGAPLVYYGEEIGMEGGGDPDNRRSMQWERANAQNEMLSFYKKLARVRRTSREIQSGDPQVLVLVALNRSKETRTVSLSIPAGIQSKSWSDALANWRVVLGAGRKVSIELAPLSAAILLPSR